MFDAVRNNKRIVQVFLALITLPFAFWGVDSYFRSSSGADELAKVGGSPISRQEFSLAMRDQQERLPRARGDMADPLLGGHAGFQGTGTAVDHDRIPDFGE